MSNKCSLAIAPCKSLAGAISHNRQRDKLDYVIPNGEILTHESQAIKNLDLANVHKYEREQIANLEQIIKDKTGRKSQVKDFYLDGLISLGRGTFENLTPEQKPQLHKKIVQFIHQEFKQKLNANIQHVSFHYDEGHKNDKGEWVKNPHVHFTVENVNRDTGKSINRTITKAQLKNLQTSLANHLNEFGFERGRDYSANKEQVPKQVYWKDFKRQQEALSKDKNREQMNSLKSENQQLQQENNDLETQLEELNKSYNSARQELKNSGQATQQDYKQLKESKNLLVELLQPKLSETAKMEISATVQKMVADAFNEGRNSFALGLESLNDSTLRSVALKSIKMPEVNIANVGYNPSKANILTSVERAMQLVEIAPQKPINIEEITQVQISPIENNTQNQAIINQLNQQIQDLQKQLEDEKSEKKINERKLETLQKSTDELKTSHNKELENKINDKVKIEVERDILKSDILNLQKENNALKNAVERFLGLGVEKGISIVGKSIVERLNAITERFKKQLTTSKQQNQKIESQQAIQTEQNHSRGMSR